jgi:glucokinase
LRQFAIGVDLGGTNLRASAVTPEGEVLEDFQIPTDAADGPERVVERMVAGIVEVREGHSGVELIGIGVGVPGLVRHDTGVVAQAPNLPGWREFPLKEQLEKRLGLPVLVENDANVAALGEVWLGAGRDVDDLILLTLGTGIGGGIVSRGLILRGADGMAGELGHMTVDPDSPYVCGCGNRGCLEALAAGTAVRRRGEEAVAEGRSAVLRARLESDGELTPLAVAEAAGAGDEAALEIFRGMGRALGISLAALVNAFNFPLYLLGGGVLDAWDLFAPTMMEEIRQRSITFRRTKTRVERARLGGRAGIFGAAYLPIQAESGRPT